MDSKRPLEGYRTLLDILIRRSVRHAPLSLPSRSAATVDNNLTQHRLHTHTLIHSTNELLLHATANSKGNDEKVMLAYQQGC